MLRKKVIDVAVNEVNDKTDLKVGYKLLRSGRKITAVSFAIESKKEEATLEDSTRQIMKKLQCY